jgi:beta-glucosidase
MVPPLVKAGKPIRAFFRVTNTGSRTGTEVAQVHLSLPGWTGEPPKRLVGWERVTLAPHRSRLVEVEIDPAAPDHPTSYWNDGWRIPPGPFKVSLARSATQIEDSSPVLVLG